MGHVFFTRRCELQLCGVHVISCAFRILSCVTRVRNGYLINKRHVSSQAEPLHHAKLTLFIYLSDCHAALTYDILGYCTPACVSGDLLSGHGRNV